MSGAVKSVGKAFKKVTKVVKKIAIPALIVGAVVLTGGAALGALPAVGSMVGGLGLGTAISGALTGAVTAAGYGAVIGGAMAAATGKDVIKGAIKGGVTGAITGGITGGISPGTVGYDPTTMSKAAQAAGTAAVAPGTVASGMPSSTELMHAGKGGTGFGAAMQQGSAMQSAGVVAPTAAAPAAAAPTGIAKGFGAAMQFVEKNPLVAGAALEGIGSVMAGSDAGENYAQARKNYGAPGGGGGFGGAMDAGGGGAAAPTQTSRFFEPTGGKGKWEWNPSSNRVEWVPAAVGA